MNLRDYQQDAVLSVARGFVEFQKQLAVIPTGGGKTICFAALANRFHDKRKERTLILAHREELVEQAVDKIFKATGLAAEVEKAERRASLNAPVVVASVQTMQGKRLERWPADHFGLVVCDEAHHAIATSWQKPLSRFDQRAKILGVTATPGRGDKKNLGQYFENIAYEIGIIELIQRGYLSPIVIRTLPLKFDLSGVKQTSGDYDANQLAEAIEPMLRAVIEELKRVAMTRKILVFLPLIKTSKLFVDLCNQAGMKAAHVDGEMEDRKSVLDAYARNEFQILSNAMLLLEGYDQPDIDCVAMLRPTKSSALYAQAVGRGTRIFPTKANLLLLDFLWLHEKHNLIRPANLIAKDDEEAKAMTKASEGDKQLDLMGLQAQAISDREASLAKSIAEQAKKKGKVIRLEEIALAIHQPDLAHHEPSCKWESQPATPGQLAILEKFKIVPENKGHASRLLEAFRLRREKGLATPNQVIHLKRMRHPKPEEATFEEAKAFLDEKWKMDKTELQQAIRA